MGMECSSLLLETSMKVKDTYIHTQTHKNTHTHTRTHPGEWRDNDRSGLGTMYWIEKRQVYQGEWLEGRQVGGVDGWRDRRINMWDGVARFYKF